MNNNLAPITIFVYNRPWHTKETIEALKQNRIAPESDLFIFSDGPKSAKDEISVAEVRSYINDLNGFKSINIIAREKNYGLASSIISGVTEIVNKFGKIIVLEDDMISSPFFLRYMNDALTLYENDQDVISIHGYIYPVKRKLPETFFIKGADCWGWATWKRGWDLFEDDGSKLLNELQEKRLSKEFNFNNTYNFDKMLEKQVNGQNNSWAIRWYASAFLQNKLTLYPGKSLINNIGLDGTGTHCTDKNNKFNTDLYQKEIVLTKIPTIEDEYAKKIISQYFKSLKPSYKERVINKAKKIWKA